VKCLSTPLKATESADETATILTKGDEAKRKCAAAHFAWYRERQAAAAGPVDPVKDKSGHDAKAKAKAPPKATWE
jgi:hypothetical protein